MVDQNGTTSAATELDVVVVGAGFAGMYLLHRLRGAGLLDRRARGRRRRRRHLVLEPVPGRPLRHPHRRLLLQLRPRARGRVDLVGEVRHPARDPPLRPARRRQARPAPRHPLRDPGRGGRAGTRRPARWHVRTEAGRRGRLPLLRHGHRLPVDAEDARHRGRRPLRAARCTSPAAGPTRASTSPASGSAVIGTGSSGIQSIPIIAEQAAQLTVFQRTPNFSHPRPQRPGAGRDALAELEADRAAYREAAQVVARRHPRRAHRAQRARWSTTRPASSDSTPRGSAASCSRSSASSTTCCVNPEANEVVAEFIRGKIRSIVDDPETAEALCPTRPPLRHQAPLPRHAATTPRTTCRTCAWSTCASTRSPRSPRPASTRPTSPSSSTPSSSPPASTP